MRVADIMTTDVAKVAPQVTADAAWTTMRVNGVRHLVVMEGPNVLGVITHRDLGGPRGESVRKGRTVAQLMSRPVVSAAPTDTLRRAANLMRGRTIGCLPIVDGRRVVGIITVTDLLDAVGRAGERPVAKGRRWTLKDRGQRPNRRPGRA
jgi:acetoin utilization protein AcuB